MRYCDQFFALRKQYLDTLVLHVPIAENGNGSEQMYDRTRFSYWNGTEASSKPVRRISISSKERKKIQ